MLSRLSRILSLSSRGPIIVSRVWVAVLASRSTRCSHSRAMRRSRLDSHSKKEKYGQPLYEHWSGTPTSRPVFPRMISLHECVERYSRSIWINDISMLSIMPSHCGMVRMRMSFWCLEISSTVRISFSNEEWNFSITRGSISICNTILPMRSCVLRKWVSLYEKIRVGSLGSMIVQYAGSWSILLHSKYSILKRCFPRIIDSISKNIRQKSSSNTTNAYSDYRWKSQGIVCGLFSTNTQQKQDHEWKVSWKLCVCELSGRVLIHENSSLEQEQSWMLEVNNSERVSMGSRPSSRSKVILMRSRNLFEVFSWEISGRIYEDSKVWSW